MLAAVLALSLAAPSRAAAPQEPAAAPAVTVLTHAYSHNDYEQARPLFDALDRGFMGVEADVHLRGEELFVAHTGGSIRPGRTLRSLYLDPLLARVRANGGRVYPGGPKGFLLMVEFKSDAEDSYRLLEKMLVPYHEMLTKYYADHVDEGAVTIVITGHRPNDLLRAQNARWAGIDGDFGDFDEGHPTLMPTISDSFQTHFDWRTGRMDFVERWRLGRYVERAHAHGRKIRLYAIPDRDEAYALLLSAGVDYLNTDHLDRLQSFLLRRMHGNGLTLPQPDAVSFDRAAR